MAAEFFVFQCYYFALTFAENTVLAALLLKVIEQNNHPSSYTAGVIENMITLFHKLTAEECRNEP